MRSQETSRYKKSCREKAQVLPWCCYCSGVLRDDLSLQVIQGPPGTGKTSVSIQILRLWAACGLKPVLAAAQNNVAVDNMCDGLHKSCGALKIVRLGAAEKVGGIAECSFDVLVDQRLRRDAENVALRAAEGSIVAELQLLESSLESLPLSELCKSRVEQKGGLEMSGSAATMCFEERTVVHPPSNADDDSVDNSAPGSADRGSAEARASLIQPIIAQRRADLEASARAVGVASFEQEAGGNGDVKSERAFRQKQADARAAVLQEADVVFAQLITAGGKLLRACGSFEGILIDEVAQATELSTVVPIALRLANGTSPRGCRLVLVGDHCQLPPGVTSREAERRGLGVSLYARLVMSGGVKTHFLDTQHRQHPTLSQFSSKNFYGGKLVTREGVASSRPPPPGVAWPNPTVGLAFLDVSSPAAAESNDALGSKLNASEAELVLKVVADALRAGGLTAEDIGVVTPYSAQVRLLSQGWTAALEARKNAEDGKLTSAWTGRLEIGSVDAFQGREKELIVFSAVRHNSSGSVGFLGDWRRLNVMLTRPKRGLVVVGSGSTLRSDPHWRRWVEFASDMGALVSRSLWVRRATAAATLAESAGFKECAALCRNLSSRPWGPSGEAGEGCFAEFVLSSMDKKNTDGNGEALARVAFAAFRGELVALPKSHDRVVATPPTSGGATAEKKKKKKKDKKKREFEGPIDPVVRSRAEAGAPEAPRDGKAKKCRLSGGWA